MAVNKVEYAGKVLLDLTEDTVNASDLAEGITAHGANGELVTGTIKEGNPTHSVGTPSYSSTTYAKLISIKATADEGAIIRSGSEFSAAASASEFGDAKAEHVLSGHTFTSANGLKIVGTMEASGGNNNCEAYLVDVTNPTVSFKTATGAIKAYGYSYATKNSQWGGSTTTMYAFNGVNYYKSAVYGSPTATNITLGVSGGKLTGLPSGLSGGTLLVTRGI